MYDDLSDAKKLTTFAISCGVPNLYSGISSLSEFKSSWVRCEFIEVSITPGDTQFTLIPDNPTSFAKALAPEIRKFYDSYEGKAYFEKWLAKHPEYDERTPDAPASGVWLSTQSTANKGGL